MPKLSRPASQRFLRSHVATIFAVAIFILAAPASSTSAASCPATITACGCTMDAAAVYVTSGALVSASPSVDCIDITAAGAVLALAGNITGPGGGVTADGIHVMSGANNSFVIGSILANFSTLHTISGFATGVQVDANNVAVDLIEANSNTGDGAVFNSVTGGDFNIGSALMNGGAGVRITGGSGNFVIDSSVNHNVNGVVLANSTSDRFIDSSGNSNSNYGVWIDQTTRSHIKDSSTDSNTGTGTYIGCHATAGPTGAKCPSGTIAANLNTSIFSGGNSNGGAGIGIDLGSSANVMDGNGGGSNGTFDAQDSNKKCDHNIWFGENFAKTSQACIH